VEEEAVPAPAGAIIYVRAGVDHDFRDITQDLRVLVFFSETTPEDSGAPWLAFHLDDVLARRKTDKNVWYQFLDVPTMRLGAYLLPQSVGGDTTKVHDFAELNLVVNGSGTFRVGGEEVALEAGDLVFVEAGVGHFFHSLDDDLDILILFENP
jgi:mannose-6-phosphate isomerase-like protein (cupin superfamily)